MRRGSCATRAPPRRRRPHRRAAGGAASSREADAVLARSAAQKDDLGQVEGDDPVLALQLEPAGRLGRALSRRGDLLPKLLQLRLTHANPDHLAAHEADLHALAARRAHEADLPRLAPRLRHQFPSPGWITSVSTPPVALGWRNATCELRIPRRGCWSLLSTPAGLGVATARLQRAD